MIEKIKKKLFGQSKTITDRVDEIFRRFSTAQSARAQWENIWRDCVDYTMPNRTEILGGQKGERRDRKIFDSTPVRALDRLASALHSMLTSPYLQWFELEIDDSVLNEKQDVKTFLEESQEILKKSMETSKFSLAVHEVYMDLGGTGTACLFTKESRKEGRDFVFSCRNTREIYILEDDEGDVDTVFRQFEMTARQIIQRWKPENVGKAINDIFKKNPDEYREVLHVVLPRVDYDGSRKDKLNMPFASIWIDIATRHMLDESGFNEFAYTVPRWAKASGEVYGRSPVMANLGDILTLNAEAKTLIKAAQKVADPPLNIPSEMDETADSRPGGQNIYDEESKAKIEPWQLGANFPINLEMMDQLRMAISDGFFITQLQMVNAKEMTAEEVRARTQENMRILGPVFGRLQVELFKPLVERCFAILMRAGKLPPIPESLSNVELKIKYSSPIAKAQQAYVANAIANFVKTVLDVSEKRPAAADVLDLDASLKVIADLGGVPAKLINSDKDIQIKREARAKAEKEQADITKAAEVAKGLKDEAGAAKQINEIQGPGGEGDA